MTPARPHSWFGCKGWLCIAALAAAWFGADGRVCGAEKSVLPEFLIRSWDSADGMPEARVSATVQTDDGYLWVGTGGGLARFDGTRFVVLTTNNTPALGDNRITSLLVSRSGDLWVGTEGGFLSRRHGGVFARVGPEGRFCTNRISALAEEGESVVWVGTRGAGLARWSPGACEWFGAGKTTNVVDNWVTQVVADHAGRLWAVVSGKLFAFNGGAWQQVAEGPLAELRLEVAALTPARDGGVWIAACPPQLLQGRGTQLFRYDSHGWTSQLAPYPWRQDSIFTSTARLMEDEAGRVWVATVGAGIFVWSPETGWQPLISSSESPLAECSCLAEGKEGVIWVGTTDFLLFQIRDRPVKTLQLPETASQHVVLGACARVDGSVWVGTDGQGAYRYSKGVCEPAVFAPDLGELQSHVAVLYEDPRTNLWAGTWAGLHELEKGQFRPVTDFGPLTNVVLTLRTDSRGNLWAGTSAGVVRYGPDGTNLFARAQGIDHFYIRAIEEDRAGQIWVAITDRGLYRKTGERFEHFGAGQWAGETRIRELHADSDGVLWITTEGLGLACFKDGKFA